ncbi:MAG: phytanoyl-CoA dioxygenase family protein [Devosiaceae bacterium]|nr:phytanoyl-CoA dioxygenase family protein [Devosiaceae bacterium MH13]
MMNPVRNITEDEKQCYRENGFVLLKGILDLPTINRARRAINGSLDTANQSDAAYNFSLLAAAVERQAWADLEAASGGQHDVVGLARYMEASGKPVLRDETDEHIVGQFFVDTGSASRLSDFRKLITRGVLPKVAAALLDGETVRLVDDQVFVKGPSTPERTAFHQDATYMPMDGDQCCVLWIPVDETSLETGTMQYVRGSHKDGALYQPNMFISQATLPGATGPTLPDIEAEPNEFDIVHFETEPGDVLVHHYRTIHGTGGNASPMLPRRALSVRYAGDDIRYMERPYAPARPHHTQTQTTGEILNDADFPVVWRRPPQQQAA